MRRWIIISFVIVLFLTIYEISDSFSLFESQKVTIVNNDIGSWQIKINEDLINEVTSFKINNVKVNSDINTKEDCFAPGTEGYFDVIIDPNDTDVSIYYELVVRSDMIQNSQIHLTRIENIGDGDLVMIAPMTYAGVIPLEDIDNNVLTTIRFYITWDNSETNNEIDSMYGSQSANFEIPMTITFKQYMGEELIEYNG